MSRHHARASNDQAVCHAVTHAPATTKTHARRSLISYDVSKLIFLAETCAPTHVAKRAA